MRKIRVTVGICIFSLSLLQACTGSESFTRVDGIVKSHVDAYQLGTGGSTDLVRGNQMVSGFDYGDVGRMDWKSVIEWELTGHSGESDVYQFKWSFSPSGGTTASTNKTVRYDGKSSVIVFQNEQEVISIEPGSIPLTKNSEQIAASDPPTRRSVRARSH